MVELYPHQREALDKLKNGSILWGDVGTGKSLVAVAYYMEREAPKDVVVITTAKKRDSLDWDREFIRYGLHKSVADSPLGSLTIDSWNNLDKYVGRRHTFFIFDEQRVVGTGSWAKDFVRIAREPSNGWLLLSATPGDTWLDYIPVFLAHGFYANRTEFLRNHVVFTRYAKYPKVERYTAVGRLVKLRNSLLVQMPYMRHTTRNVATVLVDHDREGLERVLKKRWHIFENRPLRDVAELFSVMRKVVNSSPSRMDQLRILMEKHPKLIVFYNFDFELEALRTLAASFHCSESEEECQTQAPVGTTSLNLISPKTDRDSSTALVAEQKRHATSSEISGMISMSKTTSTFLVAEWNGHKHQPIPTSDRWIYLVQYQAGAEGWNCIETDSMVFYSLTYSYKNWHQAFGRIDRLNTPWSKLNYYVFMSNSVIDKAIWKSLQEKKSFNERRFLSKILDTASQKTLISG